MGNTAVLRRPVHHGRWPGPDRRHQQLGPTGQPSGPRRCLDGDDADPHRVLHVGQLHQQRSLRRGDDTDRWAICVIHPRARRQRCAVVGPATGHRPRRQPHPHRGQRQRRRGRDRPTRRTSHHLLGFHQTRGGRDGGVVCAFRRLPLAALLRLELARRLGARIVSLCEQRISTSSSPSWPWILTPPTQRACSLSTTCRASLLLTRPESPTPYSWLPRCCVSFCRAMCRTTWRWRASWATRSLTTPRSTWPAKRWAMCCPSTRAPS